MRSIFYFKIARSCLLMLFFYLFRIYLAEAQPQGSGCSESSIFCWEKVYLNGGVFNCTDMSVKFHDDFNGNQLDPNWALGTVNSLPYNNECEESYITPNNVLVNGGLCHILGKHENYTDGIHNREFTTGSIKGSQTMSSVDYGRYEAVIDLPGGGWWSAFWMWHHEEIDIMEHFYSDTFLYNSYPSHIGIPDGLQCEQSNKAVFANLNQGFHTFAAEWTPFKLTYFYDGQALQNIIYKYYQLDGTPYNVDCNSPIAAGYYYLNPKFPHDYRDGGNGNFEWTFFKPIVGMTVLPRYGLTCCPPNDFCNSPSCTLTPCGDFGNPFDQNGEPRLGTEPNTEMLVDRVTMKQLEFDMDIKGLISIKIKDGYCPGEIFSVRIEDLSRGLEYHKPKGLTLVSVSSNLIYLSKQDHNLKFEALNTGPATIIISYIDKNNQTQTVEIKTVIYPTSSAFCSNNTLDVCNGEPASEISCCPANSVYDGHNCFMGTYPQDYTPHIIDGDLVVDPNLTISTNNFGCPVGYQKIGNYCYSGISFNDDKYDGFFSNNKLYVKPDCGNIRDCCPPGFTFDGVNCNSGVSYPSNYQGFIYNNRLYVNRNCKFSDLNNCCPPGFYFDGVHCASNTNYPAPFSGFLQNYTLYTKPYCLDPSDCCPTGYEMDATGNCRYKSFRIDSRYTGFGLDGTFYAIPDQSITAGNYGCPPGLIFDGVNCIAPVTYESGYSNPTIDDGYFYVEPHCPQDPYCCPPGTYYDSENCRVKTFPPGYNGFEYGNNFYVQPNCQISTNNNCCPPGFGFDGQNCWYSQFSIPVGLTGFVLDGENVFYTTSYCDEGKMLISEPSVTAINQKFGDQEPIVVYPNPVTNTLHIKSLGGDIVQIEMFDMWGKLLNLISSPNKNGENEIAFQNFPSGRYVIKCTKDKGVSTFVIQKS